MGKLRELTKKILAKIEKTIEEIDSKVTDILKPMTPAPVIKVAKTIRPLVEKLLNKDDKKEEKALSARFFLQR